METVELVLRGGGGLLAVLGTIWVLVRVVKARNAALGTVPLARLRVVARASVGRRASVVSIDAGDRVLVVGVTDEGVRLLAEQPALPAAAPVTERVDLDLAAGGLVGSDGPVATTALTALTALPSPRTTVSGSLVEAATWRQAVGVVRDWTVRR